MTNSVAKRLYVYNIKKQFIQEISMRKTNTKTEKQIKQKKSNNNATLLHTLTHKVVPGEEEVCVTSVTSKPWLLKATHPVPLA